MTRVDEHKSTGEIGPLEKVLRDELMKAVPISERGLGISIARKIHHAPILVDREEIDFTSAPGFSRNTRQRTLIREKIEQGRFANIRTTDEREFRQLGNRTGLQADRALHKDGGVNFQDRRRSENFGEANCRPYNYSQAARSNSFKRSFSVAEVLATNPRACAKCTSSSPSMRVNSRRG